MSNVPAAASTSASAWRTSPPSPPRDELKFVLASREDYDYARDFIRHHALESNAESKPGLILSPAFRKDATGSRSADNCLLDPRELAEWMLADNLQARLGLQIHKFIWEPQLKGV